MVAKKRRIDEIGDESRRRILDAAEALFGEKGFDKTSFVDIAERSGISRGSIPWHFTNKDGLLVAVHERAVERFLADRAPRSVDEYTIRKVIVQSAEWFRQPAAAMFFSALAVALSPEDPIHDHVVAFNRTIHKRLTALLREFVPADGTVDPERLAEVINGALTGLYVQWHLDPTFELEVAMDALAGLVERMVGITTGTSSPRPRSESA